MSVKVHEAFCLDSARRRFHFGDHFLGDSIRDLWRDTGTGSATVIDAQDGGIVRITTGATSGDLYQIDWNDIRSLHVDKKVTMEIRVKLSSITNIKFNYRLHQDNNDRITIFRDTDTAVTTFISCRDDGGDTTVDSGITTDTDWHIYRIEAFPTGEVHFYYDGVETANSPITTNIPDEYLQPYFSLQTRENATKSLDIDYCVIRQDR